MALIDSENAFKERCDRLDPQLFDLLKAQDIKSFSSLGFAVGSPQAPVEEAEFSTFSEKVFGAGATLGSTSKLRRLHFESVTFLLADLQNQVTSTELTEPSRRLPFVEKQAVGISEKPHYGAIAQARTTAESQLDWFSFQHGRVRFAFVYSSKQML